jgi:putative membrane protein
MPSADDSRDPRVYLAVERTFLAWIRTGLALMGFGFVVARFGLFLRELASMRVASTEDLSGLSVPLGTGLIVIGVAVNILASINHVRFIRRLNEGTPPIGRPSALALIVAVVLAVAGLVMAIYLGSHEIK